MNVSTNKKVLTILFLLLAILLPLSTTAQGDSGRRKRPKLKTEQTPPTKNPPAKRQPTVSKPDGYANNHGYVDLGLPSGLMWATSNVGASTPGEVGDHFAWGETTTKSSYDESNSLTFGKSVSVLRSAGIINESGNLTMNYDAARANWGGSWRMPTIAECKELIDRCTWNWATYGNHKGYKVTGPNGNSIFLPAPGYSNGSFGGYWIPTPDRDHNAYEFSFDIDFDWPITSRAFLKSVRPVFAVRRLDYVGHDYVDLGLPSGLKWATCNVGASSPEEYGGYYAWGETTTKSSYDESNSLTSGKSVSELWLAGIIDDSGNLTMQYDAARANWGGSWRMPTKTECQELKDRCVWNWTSQNGHTGYKVVGPNGNSIFLQYETEVHLITDIYSIYRSSSTSIDGATSICGSSEGPILINSKRCRGFLIRPVSE